MHINDYQDAMARTYKKGRLQNHVLGLCGEAGEVAELVKKGVYHDKPYPKDVMKKELGDALWYVAALAEDHGLSLLEIAEANIAKLKARYPEGFVTGGGIRTGEGA